MNVLQSQRLICVDVDDTLIAWGSNPNYCGDEDIAIIDGKHTWYGTPNYKLIELLKKHKHWGKYTIVVWSQSGWEWAELIVKELGMEKDVDMVMSKPDRYYDDLEIKEQGWLWELPPEGE